MTKILNEDFLFSSAPLDHRRAFLGVPERMRLNAGVSLYRWGYSLIRRDGTISPWWSFVIRKRLPSGLIVEGLRDSEIRARRLGVTHRTYDRARVALSEKFNNNMENILTIRLTRDVFGFAGTASGQPQFDDRKHPELRNVFFIGGKGQVYIPNLTRIQLQETLAVA
jgi:hypothetical protein